jgi:hypothetical protein
MIQAENLADALADFVMAFVERDRELRNEKPTPRKQKAHQRDSACVCRAKQNQTNNGAEET